MVRVVFEKDCLEGCVVQLTFVGWKWTDHGFVLWLLLLLFLMVIVG